MLDLCLNWIRWTWDRDGEPDHDDVIKLRHFPRYWPFVRGIHRSPVNSPHKGQWRGALMFSLICVRTNGWVNNRQAGDLRRYRTHYDVIVMFENMSQVYCMLVSLYFEESTFSIFFPWLCVWCACTIIYFYLLHIVPGKAAFLFPSLLHNQPCVQMIRCIMAWDRNCFFAHYHHYADLAGVELTKRLSDTFCRVRV